MIDSHLDDPARLDSLRATGLLDRDPGPAFGRVARMACRLLSAPTAVVSLIDDLRQVIVGQVGLGVDDGPVADVPLARSVCAYVVRAGGALLVDDLREHPVLADVTALAGAGAVAYAGVPIATVDGHHIGVVCVVDSEPRAWSERDAATLADLAALTATEIELRVARRTQRELADTARTAAVLERYRLLSQAGRDIILFLRAADGRVVEANEAAVEAYGHSRDELLRMHLAELRAPETLHTLPEFFARAANASIVSESVHRRRDGSTFPVEGSARGAEVGGERLLLCILRDISARRAAEAERLELFVRAEQARVEAERANGLKDEFLSTLSHELRTPLNAILGWTRMLQSPQLPESRRAHALATIERNAQLQARLVDDILDVSRIVSGKLPLAIEAVDPTVVVWAAVDSVRPAAEARALRIEVTCDRGVGTLSADPGRVQQVVWNLLSNAVKFTPRGGRVDVRVRRIAEHLEIEVADTGQGIAPAFLPHVFERFRQADAGSARQHGGLGLGLAIVRHLVELHGGTVAVSSAGVGRGACFVARFPLIAMASEDGARWSDPGAAPTVPGDAPGVDADPALDGVRVLVVDDEADARELLCSLLQSCGAIVSTAGDAAEAARLLRAERPDVMVSDIGMPGEDGLALIARVRRWAPSEGGAVPAVALTAFARPEDRARAISAGFTAYLTKPVDLSLLLRTVARVLRGSLVT